MKNFEDAIKFIAMGLTLGFSLVVYANSSFATKYQIESLRNTQQYIIDLVLKRLDRIEAKIDKIDK